MQHKGNNTHLIIPDSHAMPSKHNGRYELLGRLIYDLRPDVVVDIGDSADMESLCTYDKGKTGYESRRYLADCDAYKDAMERLWHPYRKHKRKMPLRVKTRGNHEQRIIKAGEYAGVMSGTFGIEDLEEHRYNDIVKPFLVPTMIDGVTYNHYCPTPIMNKPVGGTSPARAILKQEHRSMTTGHSHLRDFFEERGLLSLVVGCYVDYWADYAGPANNNWWAGVVLKTHVENGYYDHRWISYNAIQKEYA